MIALLILLAQWPGLPDDPASQYPPPVYRPYWEPSTPEQQWQQQLWWSQNHEWQQREFQQELLDELRLQRKD